MNDDEKREVCAWCGNPAVCFGAYEDNTEKTYACNECCGHGCEDGHCDMIGDDDDD